MPIFVLTVIVVLFIYLGYKLLWKPSIAIVITFALLGAILGIPEGPPGMVSGVIGGIITGVAIHDLIAKL